MTTPPQLADAIARQRIARDLDVNFLVEAGAGSGKTTSLVDRLCALVASGVPVERIAAVTFTRKAANELRERFQNELEKRALGSEPGSVVEQRVDAARREIDRAFLGTIHAFCGRLLRERPLEVGLDPSFEEVSDDDWKQLERGFWNGWLERARRENDPALAALSAVGIEPRELSAAFSQVVGQPDVEFPFVPSRVPNVDACRRELTALLHRAEQLRPRGTTSGDEDRLMRTTRMLAMHLRTHDWRNVADFCDALEDLSKTACGVVQKNWGDDKSTKQAAKLLGEDFLTLLDGEIANVLRCWREHRYPIVMEFVQRAAAEFARQRHETGQLGFEDLLLLAARLLREHPHVRDELGRRWSHLLVDEFQDTDPIQAEVCLLLTSNSLEGDDWRRVRPRAGSLFVVGDPKQSIYRFRRADIQIYELVKARFREFGEVLSLTSNFRSTKPIESLVNDHFASLFPAEGTETQAPFSPMQTQKKASPNDGIYRYTIDVDGLKKQAEVMEQDAAMVASWIVERIRDGRQAGDFLILTPKKAPIETYARALAERNVAVTTTGAELVQEYELRELLVVLRAIADPENGILVVAALEGLFFGLSHAELFEAKQAGIHFSLTHPPAETNSPTGRALGQLHEWWKMSQRQPADVLLERIIDETGLLYFAASQELGDARAGALLHLVDALRVASVSGASAITDAMDRIETLLSQEAPDAPLRPGRTDAVRVMNLHKAKGLEAPVVLLVAPAEFDLRDPTLHVERTEGARARGGLAVTRERRGVNIIQIIAQPPGWAQMVTDEQTFIDAERQRLVYVAATRAMHELVVARTVKHLKSGDKAEPSIWSRLDATLKTHATVLDLPTHPAPGRKRTERSAEEIAKAIGAAESTVRAASTSSLRITTVTESAKAQREEARTYDLPTGTGRGLGAAWGRAVHRSLEALGRRRDLDALAPYLRAIARDEELDGEQTTELERLVRQVAESDVWRRLVAGGAPMFELPVMRVTGEHGAQVVTEGVIDAASLDAHGWQIVDWKTDVVSDDEWRRRLSSYEGQVRSYAEILAALSGARSQGVIERVRAGGSA